MKKMLKCLAAMLFAAVLTLCVSIACAHADEAYGSVTLSGVTILEGRELREGQFEYMLVDAEGNVWSTAMNTADGDIVFPVLEYTREDLKLDGEYVDERRFTYTMTEVAGDADGYTYSGNRYNITVTVADNGDGTLTVTAVPNGEENEFVNSYEARGSVTLTGAAILEGREFEEGQFMYELDDADGNALMVTANAADGEIVFPALEYSQYDLMVDGEYVNERRFVYTMRGVQHDADGYTYSGNCYNITVTVVDNGDGTLAVTAEPNGEEIEFVNTYEAEGSVTLTGAVILEGRELEEGQFSFVLDGEGISEKVSNTTEGMVLFSPLCYSTADLLVDGEYVNGRQFIYTMTEVRDDGDGITYASDIYRITVTVWDNGDGTLTVTAEPNGEENEFVNTYEAFGSCAFRGVKVLEGRQLTEEDIFTFEVTEDGNTVLTATNGVDGVIDFGTVEYTLADVGTHTYRVRETGVDGNGITVDTREYGVTVIARDNGDGTLAVEVSGDDPEMLDFINSYFASGELSLRCRLVLLGRELREGEFEFEMIEDGRVIQTAANTADGRILFDTIGYTLEDIGYHIYTVRENREDGSGITVDDRECTVTVSVTDNGDGTLAITVIGDDSTELNFVNTYSAVGSVTLTGTKNMVGRELTEGEYTFNVWEGEDLAATGSNTADGRIIFETISYTLADLGGTESKTFHYTVTEDNTGDSKVIHDDSEIKVTVVVAKGSSGSLDVKITEGKNSITFTNTQVNAVKKDSNGNVLTGAELQVLDSKGDVVDSWITGDEIYAIEGLEYGKEYILHEVS
ncbi:MAG: hypothetical protein IKP22_13940, partial [Clostridia bacterium]|nr:hypothetical protein [Clostridia bacterium]